MKKFEVEYYRGGVMEVLSFLKELNTEGSQEVLEKLLKFLKENSERLNSREVSKEIGIFCEEKPMAVLEKLAFFLENHSLKELEKFERAVEKSFIRTIEYASNFFKNKKILTLSNSKTLLEVFRKARPPMVFVLESHPGGEGKMLVESLRKIHLRAEPVEDLLAYRILRMVDVCLTGADYVDESGNVLNKVGTTTLAILSRELRKPFFVVADPFKFGSKKLKDTNLFEVVPSELITAIITDPEGGTLC
ncbi:translation initiation factor eIF-2B [Thermotoga sp. Xyl54]|jgi:translation initiation factor 2B subunit (eIF-2B alpha/beta/delta family)|nr:translation initiation factor eIF-2B [Thermotoga sp. Xyl54]MDK2898500.1 translation initiation factor eIF-2B subunit alpha [Thermotoga sp.]